jgi:hypothetical protein
MAQQFYRMENMELRVSFSSSIENIGYFKGVSQNCKKQLSASLCVCVSSRNNAASSEKIPPPPPPPHNTKKKKKKT